jgi:hypothetical protein
MILTQKKVDRINELLDYGLPTGLGTAEPGKMCVEAVICNVLGLPHSDDPGCVIQPLREIKIRLNDNIHWVTNQSRANGLRRLAIIQIGTLGVIDPTDFMQRVARMTIQTIVPAALRSAAKVLTGEHTTKLLTLASQCENDPTEANARIAADAAYAADAADAAYAAYAAAGAADAAAGAADAAAGAADAAAGAADAAAGAADAAAGAASAAYAAKDVAEKVLIDYAENIVRILIDMKAPACKWLS